MADLEKFALIGPRFYSIVKLSMDRDEVVNEVARLADP
jgi:hypothetical protein